MKNILLLFILFFTFQFAGCGGGPQTINLNLHCNENCNNDNAVVIKIYQLKNAEKFRHASFESIMRNPEEFLGDDIIPNSKIEKLLVPNETEDFSDVELKSDAAFLAIIGDFYLPATDGWKQIIPINSDLRNVKVTVLENSLSVVIDN
jgi:type VI secretion system VasD/TssJ family lipoprotein